jgi:hypothetical protein
MPQNTQRTRSEAVPPAIRVPATPGADWARQREARTPDREPRVTRSISVAVTVTTTKEWSLPLSTISAERAAELQSSANWSQLANNVILIGIRHN